MLFQRALQIVAVLRVIAGGARKFFNFMLNKTVTKLNKIAGRGNVGGGLRLINPPWIVVLIRQ